MNNGATVYLDWNIFNKIEKLDTLSRDEQEIYLPIKCAIQEGKIVVPYSNAHINDLHRGYIKDSSYIEGHLDIILELTKNLCIVQYWGEKSIKWHYRDVREFFQSTKDESNYVAPTFSDLIEDSDDVVLKSLKELQLSALRVKPLPNNFKEIYKADPIFSLMFPRSKNEMNQLALCEDIYAFNNKIKSDYTLYKSFRKYLNQSKLKFPVVRKMDVELSKRDKNGVPIYLTYDEAWEMYAPQKAITLNTAYDKIFDLFTKTDLKGYNQDERFANLIDDALHVIYGAHCNYFCTIDTRCHAKALVVYKKLNINSHVVKPEELLTAIT